MERLSRWMRLILANIKGKDLVERRQLTSRRKEISEKVGVVAERLAGGGSGGCSLEGMRLRSESRKPALNVKEFRVMTSPEE